MNEGTRNFDGYKPSRYNYDQLHTSNDLEYCRSYVSSENSLCAFHHPIKISIRIFALRFRYQYVLRIGSDIPNDGSIYSDVIMY